MNQTRSNVWKRIAAWCMALLFCFASLSVAAAEEEIDTIENNLNVEEPLDAPEISSKDVASGQCGSSVYWKITSDYTLVIYGTGEMENYSGVAGMPWVNYRDRLVSCRVESGVTRIGDSAFCINKFKTISLPDTLESIGEYAFQSASNLQSIQIPDNVVQIGSSIFLNCTSLKEAVLPSKLKSIPASMFSGCTMLSSISIPEGVVSINVNAFQNCSLLSRVDIPASLREIKSYAFRDCYSISDVYYKGSESARNANLTVKTTGNSYLLEATWHYEANVFEGTIEWNANDVNYNGKTPYVIANGKAQTPRFTVKDKNGTTIAASNYSYQYRENIKAGTAYVIVTFKGSYTGTAQGWFKIYLPATDYTMVENRDDGIYMEWHAVPGAAGYVIYRRAWSSTTGGWTDFVRWNNTTNLYWIDKTVYAGTRYQYGIKAYFERRVDPVSGATIGGNVGDNYNLGIVGPLKTTVRITTRKLNSVTGGSKQLTVKWAGSSLFTGYEVQIATDAAFTANVKTVTITDPKTYQTTIKSLKAKTTYYVRVRSYHVFEGMTYFGGWSNALNAKTK